MDVATINLSQTTFAEHVTITVTEAASIKSHLLGTNSTFSSPKYGSGTDSNVNISNLSQSPIKPTTHTTQQHEVKCNNNNTNNNNNDPMYPLLSPEATAPSPQQPSPFLGIGRGGSPSSIHLGGRYRSYTNQHDDEANNNKNRLRSIPEVKSYLEHFIPELTSQTVLTCLIIKPILIFINVFFIGYQFFWFYFHPIHLNWSTITMESSITSCDCII